MLLIMSASLFVRVICYEGPKSYITSQTFATFDRNCLFWERDVMKTAIIQASLIVIQLQRTSSRAQPRAAARNGQFALDVEIETHCEPQDSQASSIEVF